MPALAAGIFVSGIEMHRIEHSGMFQVVFDIYFVTRAEFGVLP